MANVTIYGQEGCTNCDAAVKAFPEADYRNVSKIMDDYPPERAGAITIATNGELPIIVAENDDALIVLRVAEAVS